MMYDSMLHKGRNEWEAMLKLQIVEVMAAFMGGAMLAAAAELPMPYEDRLATLCGVGGILGAAFSALATTPQSHREALAMFMANAIAAYAWGPWLVEGICGWQGMTVTGRTAIGMSAILGATATSGLRPLILVLMANVFAWAKSLSISAIAARVIGVRLDEKPADKSDSIHEDGKS